ncbi:hypothetical protein [Halogranum rubrum]|uniref:Uncharacterized protein n=1 Tax=Halogranum salarium B-1 TaxID=1210908 RepID=J3JFU4_9EURY|nr:hypothetical protein [Halogranum salarium]EJN59526.1 hypothetical protein HSB1_16840 [Halogranum salarium B-1]
MPADTENGQGFDRRSLAFTLVFLTLMALWYGTHPAQFAAEFHGPMTSVLGVCGVGYAVYTRIRNRPASEA